MPLLYWGAEPISPMHQCLTIDVWSIVVGGTLIPLVLLHCWERLSWRLFQLAQRVGEDDGEEPPSSLPVTLCWLLDVLLQSCLVWVAASSLALAILTTS